MKEKCPKCGGPRELTDADVANAIVRAVGGYIDMKVAAAAQPLEPHLGKWLDAEGRLYDHLLNLMEHLRDTR